MTNKILSRYRWMPKIERRWAESSTNIESRTFTYVCYSSINPHCSPHVDLAILSIVVMTME